MVLIFSCFFLFLCFYLLLCLDKTISAPHLSGFMPHPLVSNAGRLGERATVGGEVAGGDERLAETVGSPVGGLL